MIVGRPIYLDYNATTPVAPEVADAMLPFLREHFGNPSSPHSFGLLAEQAVAEARDHVAALIGARPQEIVFTGCATEANNLALLGVTRALSDTKHHIVVSAIEHPSVMEPAKHLAEQGWGLTVIPADRFGRISPDDVARALRPDTVLVSIMHANNEVGTIQSIPEIARITRERGVLLHTDAAQSAGKVPIDIDTFGVDLLTLAGHKFYATKGVGALYIRQNTPVRKITFGAGHEHGLRPGTENIPAIVGFGVAAHLVGERLPQATSYLRELRDQLHALLIEAVPGLILNGHPEERLPNTLHVSFPGVSGRRLLDQASHIVAASLGSACHSEHDAVSGVLAAMGVDPARAAGAVRLSVGTMTTPDEVCRAANGLIEAWRIVATR